MGTTMTLDMAYDGSKGTITTKTDAETMLYNTAGKPYRLSNINPATSLTPGNTQTITYTSFEKVSTITENNYNASFTYNSDDHRIKMSVLHGSRLVVTRWYPTGSFMKDNVSGSSKLYTYIGGILIQHLVWLSGKEHRQGIITFCVIILEVLLKFLTRQIPSYMNIVMMPGGE
jgi:hypothetical protein